MSEVVHGTVAELLALLLSALGSGVFTLGGLLVERAGIADVLAGQSAFGIWEVYMGTLALFVGLYLLGYGTAWPRLRAVVSA